MKLNENKNLVLSLKEIEKIISLIDRSDSKMTADEYDLISDLKEKKQKMVSRKLYLQLYTSHHQALHEFKEFMQQVKISPMGEKNYKFYPYSMEYIYTSDDKQYVETRRFVTVEKHFDGLVIDGFEIHTGLVEDPDLQRKVNDAVLKLTDSVLRSKR